MRVRYCPPDELITADKCREKLFLRMKPIDEIRLLRAVERLRSGETGSKRSPDEYPGILTSARGVLSACRSAHAGYAVRQPGHRAGRACSVEHIHVRLGATTASIAWPAANICRSWFCVPAIINPTGAAPDSWQGTDRAQPSKMLTAEGLRNILALIL
jgi:hypothetical protein